MSVPSSAVFVNTGRTHSEITRRQARGARCRTPTAGRGQAVDDSPEGQPQSNTAIGKETDDEPSVSPGSRVTHSVVIASLECGVTGSSALQKWMPSALDEVRNQLRAAGRASQGGHVKENNDEGMSVNIPCQSWVDDQPPSHSPPPTSELQPSSENDGIAYQSANRKQSGRQVRRKGASNAGMAAKQAEAFFRPKTAPKNRNVSSPAMTSATAWLPHSNQHLGDAVKSRPGTAMGIEHQRMSDQSNRRDRIATPSPGGKVRVNKPKHAARQRSIQQLMNDVDAREGRDQNADLLARIDEAAAEDAFSLSVKAKLDAEASVWAGLRDQVEQGKRQVQLMRIQLEQQQVKHREELEAVEAVWSKRVMEVDQGWREVVRRLEVELTDLHTRNTRDRSLRRDWEVMQSRHLEAQRVLTSRIAKLIDENGRLQTLNTRTASELQSEKSSNETMRDRIKALEVEINKYKRRADQIQEKATSKSHALHALQKELNATKARVAVGRLLRPVENFTSPKHENGTSAFPKGNYPEGSGNVTPILGWDASPNQSPIKNAEAQPVEAAAGSEIPAKLPPSHEQSDMKLQGTDAQGIEDQVPSDEPKEEPPIATDKSLSAPNSSSLTVEIFKNSAK